MAAAARHMARKEEHERCQAPNPQREPDRATDRVNPARSSAVPAPLVGGRVDRYDLAPAEILEFHDAVGQRE